MSGKAEFWDYDTADAYIKAGRNPNERPTKDAWNTKAVRQPGNIISLDVKDTKGKWGILVAYSKGMPTVIDLAATKSNFVWAERLNRYVAHARMTEVIDGMLIGDGPFLVGGVPSKVVMAKNITVSLNEDGTLTTPMPIEPIPHAVLSKLYIEPILKSLSQEMTERGKFSLATETCHACLPVLASRPQGQRVGELMVDREHLFAHIFSGYLPAELVSTAIYYHAGMFPWKEIVSSSPGAMTFSGATYAKRIHQSVKSYLESWTR